MRNLEIMRMSELSIGSAINSIQTTIQLIDIFSPDRNSFQ